MPAVSPRWGAAFGLVIGVGLAVAMSAAGIPHRPAVRPPPAAQASRQPIAEQFLATWARSRAVTYAADTTFVRTINGRVALSQDGFVARRPPDWVQRQGSTWTGVLGRRRFECDDALNGRNRCTSSDAVADYNADVAREVQAFRSWLVDQSSYEVSYQPAAAGGCFLLRRLVPVLAPPLGDQARYCFDEMDVPLETEITTAGTVDHQTLINRRRVVTDDDLQVRIASIGP
ncbi:MAG: hypothetical protein JWL70_2743 [Acidimicrobiia bacterium]|nr:hypothetical protein [Acidimicrobiia bacterium]